MPTRANILGLPGSPGPKLAAIWEALSAEEREELLPHLLGGTGTTWLARELTAAGHPIGSTSLKDYRATLREGVCK